LGISTPKPRIIMGTSVDYITAKFPVKTLPLIEGEPDYENINNMVQMLYGNAASLQSPLGGGQHGHIGIIMSTVLYATLSNQQYDTPADPGLPPVPPARATGAIIEENRISYASERKIYDNHTNMDDALKSQIIDAVNDVYLSEVRNKYTGYLGVTTRDLIDHLLDRYGKITASDIEECKKRMNEPIDATQPIDVYFQRIDDCVQYAADGHVAYTIDQILQTAYHGVSTSGMYHDACKEWRKKRPADKTWPQFRRFFAAEYHDLKEQQKVNGGPTNFHGANHVHEANHTLEISNALDNLAMATTADNNIVTQLTQTNAELVKAVGVLTTQLKKALDNNTMLVQKMGANTSTNTAKKASSNNDSKFDPNGYCHTHGYRVIYGHSSATCNFKLQGHQDTATRTNTMGGNTRHKPT
jgi:hypothetical protein